jgi:LPXTG-motif cell wall-anchored protein
MLLPGDYTVAEQVPVGYYATSEISVPVVVEPGDSVSVVFSNALYGSISGHKWIDTNGNGTLDDGELPYADGLIITLYGETLGGDIISAETETAADGSYSFTLLEAGDYTVSEVVPENMTATSPVSLSVELDPGDDVSDTDFFNSITDVGGEVVTPTDTGGTTLPYTGMEQLPLLIAAGILMLLGLAILIMGYSRRFQE